MAKTTNESGSSGNSQARPPGPVSLNRYDVEPAWAGFQTFSKLPVCLTPEDLRAGAASDRVEEILAELAYVGAMIIFVGDKKPTGPVIHLPLADGAPEELSPVLAALPLSQLGFHFASLTGKRSYNFPNEQAKQEHYETIHRATVGEPA